MSGLLFSSACLSRKQVDDENIYNMWHDLAVALCLMLVIEGIIPFIDPRRWRRMLQMLDQVDDRMVRIIGLCSMLVGTIMLTLIN